MQFVKKQAAAWLVGLEPLAVNDQLWDCPLAHALEHLRGGRRIIVHVDLCVRNSVRLKELLGGPAIPAPGSRVNLHHHNFHFTAFWLVTSGA